MLELTERKLMEEIRAAQEFMRPFAKKAAEIKRKLAGRHYRADAPEDDPSPENYAYTFKQYVLPQILFGVPTANVKPTRSLEDEPVADGLELAVNSWAKQTDLKATLSQILDDCAVGFGVSKVGIEPCGDYAANASAGVSGDFEFRANFPFLERIEIRDFIIDPIAKKLSKARFVGHRFERDLADVITDQRYDRTQSALLSPIAREPNLDEDGFPDRKNSARAVDRKRVTLFELYLPEYRKIITIGETGAEACVILRNEAFWGPDDGPYTVWGLDTVPGEIIPLSPVTAMWDQIEKTNVHAVDAADSAETHKNILAYRQSEKDDAEKIKTARNGDIVGLTNPEAVQTLTLGGVAKEQIDYTEIERARTDRLLGITDLQRGEAVSNTTATASEIASNASDIRLSRMKDRIKDCAVHAFRKVLWYFHEDDTIQPMNMVQTDPITGVQRGATFFPGNPEGAYVNNTWIEAPPSTDVNDFNLDIDPQTMQKEDDAIVQRRAQDRVTIIAEIAPLIAQTPYINWRAVIEDWGKAFNDQFMADRVLNLAAMPMMNPMLPGANGVPGQAGPMMGQAPLPQAAGPATRMGMRANARGGVSALSR